MVYIILYKINFINNMDNNTVIVRKQNEYQMNRQCRVKCADL